MYLLAKASPLVLLIGGGSFIPYLLKNSNSPSIPSELSEAQISTQIQAEQDRSSQTNSGISTSSLGSTTSHSETQIESSGNCIVDEEENVSKYLTSSPKFVFFSCNNGGKEDTVLSGRWQIWMPSEILNQVKGLFEKGQKVDIKTQTTLLSGDTFSYKIQLESEIFTESKINGSWKDNIVWGESGFIEPHVFEVKLEDSTLESKFIYLQY